MDEYHLNTDTKQHEPEETNKQGEMNLIDAEVVVSDEASQSIAQSQLCGSCRYEKAVIICSVCNETVPTDNFASNDKIASANAHNDTVNNENSSNDVYFQKSLNPTSENEIQAQENNKKIDLDLLMRRGNMVYCNECFKDVHKAMLSHIPVEIFSKPPDNLDDTNQSIEDLPIDNQEPSSLLCIDENNDIDTHGTNTLEHEHKESVEPDHKESIKPDHKESIEPDHKESVIINLLNEMISISSSNLEQEELDRRAENAELIQTQMAGLYENLSNLNVRCDQFNDVKHSIKQMNDLIRNDLFMDFGTITTMLRVKLDEVTNGIKEKLKDAYSVVRDTQARIVNKISEIKVLANRIQMLETLKKANSQRSSSHSLSQLVVQDDSAGMSDEMIMSEIEQAYEKIKQINDELKQITESTGYINSVSSIDSINSHVSNSCSLFVDNSLYPKFNYFVDTRQLVEAIGKIEVQIGSTDILNPKTYFLGANDKNSEALNYKNNTSFYCSITSGISNEGQFWAQLNFNSDDQLSSDKSMDPNNNHKYYSRNENTKINMFIEEISKYIRKKRIGDKKWQSYKEAARLPEPNEKCFCLEPKTRKWLRAKVASYDKGVCKVRFMDTGYSHFESNKFSLDDLLIWHDFDLAMYPARTIRCVLFKPTDTDVKYENNICLETKFYFKDNLANKNFACELVEPLKTEPGYENLPSDEQTWIVKLSELNKPQSPETSINNMVIDFNNHELLVLENKASSKNKFGSIDIRVEAGTVGGSTHLVKTNCEPNRPLGSASSSFSGNTEKCTDSESTARVHPESNHCASSVNSFSERLVDEAAPAVQDIPNKTHAVSLPILPNRQAEVPLTSTLASEVKDYPIDMKIIEEASSIDAKEQLQPNDSVFQKVDANNNDTFGCNMNLESDENVNLDIDDQTDERRYYKDRHGQCMVNPHISSNGIFWIKPMCYGVHEFKKLSRSIGEFITKTQWKSYSELHIVPEVGKKCFVKDRSDWCRGLLENVSPQECRVRTLDQGSARLYPLDKIYPHRRLTTSSTSECNEPFHIPKYLSIRCVISPKSVILSKQSRSKMTNMNKHEKVFDLIEQVTVDNKKCWFTTLRDKEFNNHTLNDLILTHAKSPKELPQSKSTDIINTLLINDEEQQVAGSVSLHHNFSQSLEQKCLTTINNLNVMGPSYLIPENFESSKNLPTLQQHSLIMPQPQSLMPVLPENYIHSLPVNPSRPPDEIRKKKKLHRKRNDRFSEMKKEIKDDTHLDSSATTSKNDKNSIRRRRSRSADSLSGKNKDTEAPRNSLSESHQGYEDTNKPVNDDALADSPGARIFKRSFGSLKSDFMSMPHKAGTSPQAVDNLKSLPVSEKKSTDSWPGSSSNNNRRRYTYRDGCKPDQNRFRKNDKDDDNNDRHGHGKRSHGHNYQSFNRQWRNSGGQQQQQGSGSQGNQSNYNGKEAGLYKASVLNHFPNNHSDCRIISQSAYNSQLPYVVNWGCDDAELNSSAYNDVFIEDNYCTTDNDYDSKYGDDSEEEIISESELLKRQYKYNEAYLQFENDKYKHVSLESSSSDQLSKIRVTSLRDITNHHASNIPFLDAHPKSLGSKLTKTRCVYSIIHENNDELDYERSSNNQENMLDVYEDEIIEVGRGSDVNSSFGLAFLNKWNNNFREKNDFDILADSSLDKSDVMLNDQNDVTTLDLAARQINLSPGLDEGESSATKCIRPQVSISRLNDSTPKLTLPYNSSSGGSSVCSMKKAKGLANSSTTTRRTEDEDNEFYISCAEEIRSNTSSMSDKEKTPVQSPKVKNNKSAQTDSNCLFNKLEKLKHFTVAVFVDSIEDYSFEQTILHNETNSSHDEFLNISNLPTIHYPNNISHSDLDDVFLSKNKTPNTSKALPNDYFKFTTLYSGAKEDFIEINKSTLIQQDCAEHLNLNDENHSPSLKEFETIENKSQDENFLSNKSGNIYEFDPTLSKSPVISDDVFMYNNSPNNYSNLNRHALIAKPPLGPNLASSPTFHPKTDPQPLINQMNISNQCLSTITEASNETFETCSNQSSHLKSALNQKSHSTSYEDDDEHTEWTIEKLTLDDQNITLRRRSHNKKLETVTDIFEEDCTIQESDAKTITVDDLNTSVKITDKLFEKFCLVSNDDIMNFTSMKSFSDSLEQSMCNSSETHKKSLSSGDIEDKLNEQKINSKLLNEILNAHVDEPTSRSERSSCSSVQRKENKTGFQIPNHVISSSSCSKLSSASKQTVLPAKRDSTTSTVTCASLNNFNVSNSKELEFDNEHVEEDDDDVFLIEKNDLNSLNQKSNASSESDDINIEKKISSKSLNSITERKSFISNKTSSLPPSATSSAEQSFPMLNVSLPSTKSLPKHNRNYKIRQQAKNNLSATTTLEISSYTSDSLYNSNFILTPMCSDAISPALFNNFIKSPINQGSPSLNSQPSQMFSSSCPNNLTTMSYNSLTPKSRSNLINSDPADVNKLNVLKTATTPSPPPPPPIIQAKSKNLSIVKQLNNSGVFPSPPSYLTLKSTTGAVNQLSPSDSFPLPPSFIEAKNLDLEPQAPEPKTTKPKMKNKNISNIKKSLIETLTERLNLEPHDKEKGSVQDSDAASGYNGIGSLFKNRKQSTGKNIDWPKDVKQVLENTKPNKKQQIEQYDLNNNGLSDLTDKKNATDQVDASSKGNWEAANFSLYGLDNENDDKSSVDNDQNLLNNIDSDLINAKTNIYDNVDGVSTDSLPPPPIGFDDNNNELHFIDECEKYENIDDYDLYDLINKEIENKSSNFILNHLSSTLPRPPSFIENSNDSTVERQTTNDLLYEEPTKDHWSREPITPVKTQSPASSTKTVIPNPNSNPRPTAMQRKNPFGAAKKCYSASPKSNKFDHLSQKQWKNLNCETLSVNNTNHSSLLPENNLIEKKELLEKHLKGSRLVNTSHQKENKHLYSNSEFHKSCPVLSNSHEDQNNRLDESTWYKNEEFIEEVTTVTSEGKREFKLDRLLDINPKRLFKGSKFRCRIHDVIDENGKFWIEVIYSKEGERKFVEIFKLFRMCSKLSQPPATVHTKMCVSGFYKNDWHRAIVLEPTTKSVTEKKIRVRFVDLGIIKNLDRLTELREIDQKFFNCPLKALQCSINLDREAFNPETYLYQNEELKQFKFTKEARKYFTKIIYKRVLFAKIVNFVYEDTHSLDTDTSHIEGSLEEKNTICQIILGAQFHRGIIDIFMYLLSKFDRPYYSNLKKYHSYQQKLVKDGVIPNVDIDDGSDDNETSNLATNTQNISTTCNSATELQKSPVKQRCAGEKVLNNEILQILREEYIQSYGMRNQLVEEQENAVVSEIDNNGEDGVDFTEDDESSIEEVEQGLKSNSINHEDHRLHETIVFSSDTTSSDSYFSVSDDDEFDDLEQTPVKDISSFGHVDISRSSLSQKSIRYNYSEPLRINSIHLPPIKNDYVDNSKTPATYFTEQSTAMVRGRKMVRQSAEFDFTPIVIPPSNSVRLLKQKKLISPNNNASSDTDTSIVAPCCTGLHKFKWNSASKLRQKIISSTMGKSKEYPEVSIQRSLTENNSLSNQNKKVKFQLRN